MVYFIGYLMCFPSGTRIFVRWERTLIPYPPACTQPRHWYQTRTRSPRAAAAGKQWRVGFWGPVPGAGEFDGRQGHMWIKALSIDSGKMMDNGQWPMATHSSILAWKIPQRKEPDRLQSMGSQRVRHDWVTSLHFHHLWVTVHLRDLNLANERATRNTFLLCWTTETWWLILCVAWCCVVKLLSRVWFFASPGSSVHGILQARILEWVAVPFSRGSSQPRDWTQGSCTAGKFFTNWATKEAQEYWSE